MAIRVRRAGRAPPFWAVGVGGESGHAPTHAASPGCDFDDGEGGRVGTNPLLAILANG